jgi:hypothetical protein
MACAMTGTPLPHLHRSINFYESNRALAFTGDDDTASALVIDRTTAAFSLESSSLPPLAHPTPDTRANVHCLEFDTKDFPRPKTVFGIIGTIQLRLGILVVRWCVDAQDTYVLLITGKELVGSIATDDIWTLTKFMIVPVHVHKHRSCQVNSPPRNMQ